ncbi:hypothetical protein Peur_001574 [Populus x canadensis]
MFLCKKTCGVFGFCNQVTTHLLGDFPWFSKFNGRKQRIREIRDGKIKEIECE